MSNRSATPTLESYLKKRDPQTTPEPFPSLEPSSFGRLFVVQKHAARRLHYDFRLEIGGVLKSWAVPKGPSLNPSEKRLAIQVEDHPLEYAGFEGIIPKGNYGAGSVIIWDRGSYEPAGQPTEFAPGLEAGKLEFELHGKKLGGRWDLVRLKDRDNWLMMKKRDEFAGPMDITLERPESVISGMTVEELSGASTRAAEAGSLLERWGAQKATRSQIPSHMLASTEAKPFSNPDWVFEIKLDGVRVMAGQWDGKTKLVSRRGHEVTGLYPEITQALSLLPYSDFLMDGEIVCLGPDGKPSFQLLQRRFGLTNPREILQASSFSPVTCFFFDLVRFEGYDLARLSLLKRKEILKMILPGRGILQFSDHVREKGEEVFRFAEREGLEGMIAKKAESPYSSARSRDWLKIKCRVRRQFVVGGYTAPKGTRSGLGALHLGLYKNSRLVYVSKVGTGFEEADLEQLTKTLAPLKRETSPFEENSPTGRGHHWVEPVLAVEVEFSEWTERGGIRHPVFVSVVKGKNAETCLWEEAAAAPEPQTGSGPELILTHRDKVFWPAEGYTKGDLIDFYREISSVLLPYLLNRPVVLTRYPDGIEGKNFFQKDAPAFVPDWVQRERIHSEHAGREIDYFILNDLASLLYVVQLGCIPLHIWASRISSLEKPDWVVLDLDPKEAPFSWCRKVALEFHRLLSSLNLPHYLKTSGKTGLHVLVPAGGSGDHEDAKAFAQILAHFVVERLPDLCTVVRNPGKRGGKVYIDCFQNGHGKTIVAPYSVRPLPGAPVSTPIEWRELTTRLDPSRFTIKTLPRRVSKIGDPMKPLLNQRANLPRALEKIEEILGVKTRPRRPPRPRE